MKRKHLPIPGYTSKGARLLQSVLQRSKGNPITAIDGYFDGKMYLQLHAMRAPVGGYLSEDDDDYNMTVMFTVKDFETENKVVIYQLGRSGRHICIEDTPRNRRRYASLQRKAIAAARAMWDGMRTAQD